MSSNFNDAAFIRFRVMQQLRTWRWLVALVLFVGSLLAGFVFESDWESGFLRGVVLAVFVTLNFGIGYERRAGFDKLNSNFVPPGRSLLHGVAALAILYLALFVVIFAITALFWLNPRAALFTTTKSFVFMSPVLGVSLVLEILIATHYPALLAIAFLSVALGTIVTKWPRFANGTLGFDKPVETFGQLGRWVTVSAIFNTALLLIAIAVWSFQHRRRRITPP